MRRALDRAALAVVAALSLAAVAPLGAQVLDARILPERNGWLDNRDWDWYAQRVPLFESPERSIDSTYYYRWELVTRHLTYGDPLTGYTFTEFIDRPFWSGAYGAISCPLGHQLYEVRWLKDWRIVDDFTRYWFHAPGAQPRSYSNWFGDAVWATYLVRGDRAYIARALPDMKRQLAGWEAEHYDSIVGLFHWDGLHDGMERNINSRQTDDIDTGADGYRPTLNSYMFADARAISRAAALLGDTAAARAYAVKADTIRERTLRELWDTRREFFLHEFAHDEKDGVRARTHTYDSGKYAGDPHGRELIGYVPWQFELPPTNRGYERAWRFLMDTARFAAPDGPTSAERHDPLFYVSPRCCWWSGNSWPYATTQTLVALANVLNDYPQDVVTKRDYIELLRTYTRTQRKNGRPYVAEAANPDNGSWEGHDTFQHSEHYFHSGYVDLVITGLVGLRPRADDSLEVNPLAPADWPYFALDGVEYRGHRLTIFWDRGGTRYRRGQGLTILADGKRIANVPRLGRIVTALKPVRFIAPKERMPMVNLAVNNGRGAWPWVTASWSAPSTPAVALNDGNYRYDENPPNRWTDSGSVSPTASLVLDFGTPRPVEELKLYFLDDGAGRAIRAPASYAVELWQNGGWRSAPIRARLPATAEGHRANTITFARGLTTSRIRLTLAHRRGAWVGLTEIEAWAHLDGNATLTAPDAPPLDLAFNPTDSGYPRVTASFTGRDDRVADATDMRVAFTHYSRNRWTAYGTPSASDWLAVDFGAPRTVRRVELYLWGDDRGVRAPRRYTIQYWDGARWIDARELSRHPVKPLASAVNTVALSPVRTTKLRVVFEHDLPAATGVTELMVFGDR